MMYFQETSARYRAVEPSNGYNIIPMRARPGLSDLGPHTGEVHKVDLVQGQVNFLVVPTCAPGRKNKTGQEKKTFVLVVGRSRNMCSNEIRGDVVFLFTKKTKTS